MPFDAVTMPTGNSPPPTGGDRLRPARLGSHFAAGGQICHAPALSRRTVPHSLPTSPRMLGTIAGEIEVLVEFAQHTGRDTGTLGIPDHAVEDVGDDFGVGRACLTFHRTPL
jgi:hypothetical protein